MAQRSFFDKPLDHSQIKAAIVSKYVWSWATVMKKKSRQHFLAYLDLFSGHGRYKDGSDSTPLLVLKKAIADSALRSRLFTIFNDFDSRHVASLKEAIEQTDDLELLQFRPQIHNRNVDSGTYDELIPISNIPTITFIDPFGFNGLSLELLRATTHGWGCDCIFFFNYMFVNRSLGNPALVQSVNALFGVDRANELRCQIPGLSPENREQVVMNFLGLALQDIGIEFPLMFNVAHPQMERTSHYLVFLSKVRFASGMMKNIMAQYCSYHDQGVPMFEFVPTRNGQLRFSHQLVGQLDALFSDLMETFAGQSLRMVDIYNAHHPGTNYVKPNYKSALLQLEASQRISTVPSAEQRRKHNGKITFGDNTVVTFPLKELG